MAKVEITITVDTEKLKKEKPGEIKDRSIVVMTDNQKDSYYDDPTKNDYKDKLHTMVDPGDEIEWTIVAKNGSHSLSLDQCDGSDIGKIFNGNPQHEKVHKKMKVEVKPGVGPNTKAWYSYTFTFNNEKYSWDPVIETRPND